MKLYTDKIQTDRLIELGFEEPKGSHRYWRGNELVININYSIGELIEMLPEEIYIDETTYSIVINKTAVFYYSWTHEIYALLICDVQEELIDNLYDMVVQLKEEGMI